MHSGPEDAQSTLATKRIVAGQEDRGVLADQSVNDQFGQQLPEVIDIPNGMREEAMVVREVSVADRVAGEYQVGHVAMSDRQNPAGHQQPKCLKARFGENGCESP